MKVSDAPSIIHYATIQLHGPVIHQEIPDDFPILRNRDYKNAYCFKMVDMPPESGVLRETDDVRKFVAHILGPETEKFAGPVTALEAIDADSFVKNSTGYYDLRDSRGLESNNTRNPDGTFKISSEYCSHIIWLRQGDRLIRPEAGHASQSRRVYRAVRDTFCAFGNKIEAPTGALVRE